MAIQKAAIAVCDRGKGMTKRDIEEFACYSYNVGERRGEEQPYQTSNESKHIDGRLSVYGVGSKTAVCIVKMLLHNNVTLILFKIS